MKVATSKKIRTEAFNAIGPDRFQTPGDYFYFIHLNDTLRWIHSVSFLAACYIFVLSLIKLSPSLFFLQYLTSTIPAVLSHYFCDGFKNKGPFKRPAFTLRMGILLNLKFLFGQLKKEDEFFMQKYPFVNEIFRNS